MNPLCLHASLALLLALGGPTWSQRTARPDEAEAAIAPVVERELARWRERHGPSWGMVRDHGTGYARLLYGGARDFGARPVSDDDFVVLALRALRDTVGLHGAESGSLVLDRVTFLPLGLAGTTDKVSVRFQQAFDGVEVASGAVHLLFDLEGRLLSVDSQALPGLASFDVAPSLPADQAALTARAFFDLDTGLPPTRSTDPVLLVDRVAAPKLLRPRLVWEVSVYHEVPGFEGEGYRYRLDARTGAVVSRSRAIHNDVSGTVSSLASPGVLPDDAGNPPSAQPMPHLLVTSAQGNATTDANGNFTIPGATAPLNVTVRFEGSYANTSNQAGSDYSLTQNLASSSGNTVTMNPGGAAQTTAEANAFQWIGKLRDWTRAVNAADSTADFVAPANVNIGSTCNANFNGVAVNFFAAGGGCVNTAFSSVVLHEMGHWLNSLYASYNGGDGFGEGNADVFSMYVLDEPIVGDGFRGPGTMVRTGTNTRSFCGDCCEGCHGSSLHANGEVLGGALWKVRSRLKATHGTVTGGMIADQLFNAWLNAYDDKQIKTIIELHWLTLDDDNGNVYDGTPHHADIDGGFRDQGFPGVDLRNLTITNLTQLTDTLDEVGPYAVSADVVANFAPATSAVDLFYRVGGGAYQLVPMTNTSGDTWSAAIPGQAAPTKVEYYVRATDSTAQVTTEPVDAPAALAHFVVGTRVRHWFDDFESGVNGWTHRDNVGAQDDWMLSSEEGLNGTGGQAGDPANAFSGTNVWGNDLGPSGFNGAYQDDVDNSLLSPVIDCSGMQGVELRFRRWLTVEWGIYDVARVLVNGVQVWENSPDTGDLVDTAWTELVLDISDLADGDPAVQLEWNLQSDGGVTFGGWNVDDVELLGMTTAVAAGFSGSPTAGAAPLTVAFMDASSGPVTGHSWTFGDGGTSTAPSPTHTYSLPGTYDVALTVSGTGGPDTETKLGYVVVSEPPPTAAFTASRRAGPRPLAVDFTDLTTGAVGTWSWSFGDGGTSSTQHPTHVYRRPGLYTVSLEATGPGGSDVETKAGLVFVPPTPPVSRVGEALR